MKEGMGRTAVGERTKGPRDMAVDPLLPKPRLRRDDSCKTRRTVETGSIPPRGPMPPEAPQLLLWLEERMRTPKT